MITMPSRLFNTIFKISAGALVFAAVLLGQFESAEVLGTVRDSTGAVVPKASVSF